jgi:hypothetical protein
LFKLSRARLDSKRTSALRVLIIELLASLVPLQLSIRRVLFVKDARLHDRAQRGDGCHCGEQRC